MVFSMMLGVGMISDAYAVSEILVYNCDLCGKEFHTIDYEGSSDLARAARDQHTLTCTGTSSGTAINLTNSPLNVEYDSLDKTNGTNYFADETTNNWNAGSITEETRVTVDRASYFTITIPKEIVLNGDNGTATYEVSATGEIAGDQVLKVVPIADEVASRTFKLNEDGGKQVDVTVTQANTDFTYQNLDNRDVYNGTLSAPNISAGNWSGKFDFNITFTNN